MVSICLWLSSMLVLSGCMWMCDRPVSPYLSVSVNCVHCSANVSILTTVRFQCFGYICLLVRLAIYVYRLECQEWTGIWRRQQRQRPTTNKKKKKNTSDYCLRNHKLFVWQKKMFEKKFDDDMTETDTKEGARQVAQRWERSQFCAQFHAIAVRARQSYILSIFRSDQKYNIDTHLVYSTVNKNFGVMCAK